MADAVAVIGEAHRAGMSCHEKAEPFSNRMMAIMAEWSRRGDGGCFRRLGCARLAAFGDREPSQEKAHLRGEIAAMTEVSQNMQAQGLKIEFPIAKRPTVGRAVASLFSPGMADHGEPSKRRSMC